jgi:hypothetical protein
VGEKGDRVRIVGIAFVALVLACAVARADGLSDIRTLRSLSAEAAEIVRLQAQHRITETYATQMKREAREELQSAGESASTGALKEIAQQATQALDRNDEQGLTTLAQRLFAMEGPHGRAD